MCQIWQIAALILAAGGLAAAPMSAVRAQQAAPDPGQQQAVEEAHMIQQRAYQQAMTDCMSAVFPAPGAQQAGRLVDPAAYRMTDNKMQIVIKCMDGKGIEPPAWAPPGSGKFVQDYQKKNGAGSRQMLLNQANNIAGMWKREAEAIAGSSEEAISPAAPSGNDQNAVAAEPAAPAGNPPPKLYNTPPSSGNSDGGNGQKPLWVVPQSQ